MRWVLFSQVRDRLFAAPFSVNSFFAHIIRSLGMPHHVAHDSSHAKLQQTYNLQVTQHWNAALHFDKLRP